MSVVAMLLAGGQGSRLSILSQRRAKPAVPFGGTYRIIDFTLSNIMHAEIPFVGVLTQYKPYSLMDHIGSGESWGFTGRDRMARVLPPYTGEEDSDWYAGTADAIWQNRNFISRFDPELVVILSGDHIYRMEYKEMIEVHRRHRADVTIALQPVPWEETPRLGVVEIDAEGRVQRFQEKPKKDPISNLASLGIYVFETDVLLRRLQEDAADPDSSKDFGKNVLPSMLHRDRMYGYVFDGFWRDVGTIDSYWATNMESLESSSGLNLAEWELRTNYFDPRAGNELPAWVAAGARVQHSFVSRGCIVEGEVENSVLFSGVRISKGAHVRDSIVMNNCTIAENAKLDRVIADKNVLIDRDCAVGIGKNIPNAEHPELLDKGITVLGKGALLPPGMSIGKNVLVFPGAAANDFRSGVVPDGSTVVAANGRG